MTPNELAGDLDVLRSWWARLAPQVPGDIVGIWFGIVDLVRGDVVRRELYVAGSRAFDAEDETAEWACDPDWWPEDRYVWIPGMKVDADYGDALAYVTELVGRLGPQETVGHTAEGVGVGFDDGDFNLTWPVNPTA